MKRSVTGCKHFRDPVRETEYNSFASQIDKAFMVKMLSTCVFRHLDSVVPYPAYLDSTKILSCNPTQTHLTIHRTYKNISDTQMYLIYTPQIKYPSPIAISAHAVMWMNRRYENRFAIYALGVKHLKQTQKQTSVLCSNIITLPPIQVSPNVRHVRPTSTQMCLVVNW